MALDADVIVIGAGPAGCAAGVRLAAAGHDVVVLERKPIEDGEDITSGEVLAPATQTECAELGLELAGDWLLDRFHGVRNVYPDSSFTVHLLPEGMSYVNVDRGGFNAALRRRLVDAGARLVWNARVADVDIRADAARVRTADGGEYAAKLVIDAGGRYAPSARTFGLKQDDPEFRQIGVAVFFEEFPDAATGVWDRHLYGERGAMISGGRIRPGLYRYILEADLAEKQEAGLRPIDFYERTAERHDPWLHARIMSAPRRGEVWAMAPLAYRVSEVARDRLLLAGDATGYLAPLTGQGIEFAMRMGRLAARSAADALASGDFSASAFAGYVDERQSELETAIGYLRWMLHRFRDREALVRAAHDDDYRMEVFGPLCAETAERGTLSL